MLTWSGNVGSSATIIEVVVVNHCLTSLFGTKGLLSDITKTLWSIDEMNDVQMMM